MRKTCIVVYSVFLALILLSQEAPQETKINLMIMTAQDKVILGEPLYFSAKATNEGPVPAKVMVETGDLIGLPTYSENIKQAFVIVCPDGKIKYECFGLPVKTIAVGDTIHSDCVNPTGMFLKKCGVYEIKAEMKSGGVGITHPVVHPDGSLSGPPPEYFWKGHAISNTIKIEVEPPTGIDLEAYKYFKADPLKSENYKELLKKHPTSTYAAYVVYDRLKGFAGADFSNPGFLRSLETGLFLSNSYPTENGWMEMKDEMNAAWWSKWAGIILKNHPDIWFADELRLRLAMNQVALKNYQTAEADFIKLSKEAKPCIAEKAALFVEIMKQKGWVSAPVEKSVPEAVVVK